MHCHNGRHKEKLGSKNQIEKIFIVEPQPINGGLKGKFGVRKSGSNWNQIKITSSERNSLNKEKKKKLGVGNLDLSQTNEKSKSII